MKYYVFPFVSSSPAVLRLESYGHRVCMHDADFGQVEECISGGNDIALWEKESH